MPSGILARISVLVCLTSLLVLAANRAGISVPPAEAASQAAPLLSYGVDSGGLLYDLTALNVANATGAYWTRLAIYWSSLEPADTDPSHYNWAPSDTDLNPSIQAGLTPVVYVTHNPGWAAPNPCGAIDTTNPALLADFGEMMGALAAHYPQVPIWILYNEADNSKYLTTDGCFGGTGDFNQNGVQDYIDYAKMLAAARDAVRQVNPNTKVALSVAFDNFDAATCPPGYKCTQTTNFDFTFLPHLFAYFAANPRPGGAPYADLVAFNFYDLYGPYWESRVGGNFHGIQAKAQFIRQFMNTAGVSLGLFVTETGDDSQGVGTDGQSQCLVMHFVRGDAVGLEGVAWWTLADYPPNNWYYGIVDVDLAPKPSYTAFQVLVQNLSGYTFDRNLSKKKVEAYQYLSGTHRIILAWGALIKDGTTSRCYKERKLKKYAFKNVKKLILYDMYGKKLGKVKDNTAKDLDARVKIIKVKIPSAPTYYMLKP